MLQKSKNVCNIDLSSYLILEAGCPIDNNLRIAVGDFDHTNYRDSTLREF